MRPKLVVFDLDGVIFEHNDFYMQLHEKYGTKEETREIEEKYLKTDLRKLAEIVIGRIWAGRDDSGYWEVINDARLNPGVREAVSEIKNNDIKTMIITNSPEDNAKKAQEMAGIDHIKANWMEVKGGKITGRFDWRILWNSKGEILEEFCKEKGISLDEVAAVGDNENDISMMEKAGLSIAFNSRSEKLKRHCDVVIEGNDLREILKYLS